MYSPSAAKNTCCPMLFKILYLLLVSKPVKAVKVSKQINIYLHAHKSEKNTCNHVFKEKTNGINSRVLNIYLLGVRLAVLLKVDLFGLDIPVLEDSSLELGEEASIAFVHNLQELGLQILRQNKISLYFCSFNTHYITKTTNKCFLSDTIPRWFSMNLVDSTLENLTKCILYFDRVSSHYFLIKLN